MASAYPAAVQPRVGAVLGHGWQTLKGHFWILLGLTLLYLLISYALSTGSIVLSITGNEDLGLVLGMQAFEVLLTILIGMPLGAGLWWAYLRASRDEKPAVGDLFQGFRRYRDIVLAMLAVTGLVLLGFLLLIIPGIIVAIRLFMVPFLVIDEGMRPKEALRTSWESTRGHAWSFFLFVLVCILLMVAGLLALLVGVFVAAVWVYAATAAFYRAIRESSPAQLGLGAELE